MAALDFMRQRLPHAGRIYRGERSAYATHADAVADLIAAHDGYVADLRAQAEAARTLLSSPTADLADHIDATRRLREIIAGVTERSAGAH